MCLFLHFMCLNLLTMNLSCISCASAYLCLYSMCFSYTAYVCVHTSHLYTIWICTYASWCQCLHFMCLCLYIICIKHIYVHHVCLYLCILSQCLYICACLYFTCLYTLWINTYASCVQCLYTTYLFYRRVCLYIMYMCLSIMHIIFFWHDSAALWICLPVWHISVHLSSVFFCTYYVCHHL